MNPLRQRAPSPRPLRWPTRIASHLPSTSQTAKALAFAALVAVGAWAAYRYAERAEISAIIERAAHRLDVDESTLKGEITRYDYLPALLSLNPDIANLLRHPTNPALISRVNDYLADVTTDSQAAAIYVLDLNGTTLAASNWNQAVSFVGQNFSYRPYFIDARHSGTGRFYGLGSTSHLPGYFYAARIDAGGHELGVVATKISLDPIEALWMRGDETVLVADANGVVFLTSYPGWKYRTLHPLSAASRARIETKRQYEGPGALEEVGLVRRRSLGPNAEIDAVSPPNPFAPGPGGKRRTDFVVVSRTVAGTDWRIMSLTDIAAARKSARYAALVAALGLSLATIGTLYVLQRRKVIAQRLAMRETLERMNDELERKVTRRTGALARANKSLRNEITEHKRTEATLKATLEELVQAGKMALIGQMSAGITHELNQPLAALRTLSDNALLFLQRGRPDETENNLRVIAGLIERMGKITAQLRRFSHKGSAELTPVPVERALANALFLVELRLRKEAVEVVRDLPDADSPRGELLVLADANRLEQVLVNLFANALDAMLERPARQLSIAVRDDAADDAFVEIVVADTGPGIPEPVRVRLFEPFFTTKPPGAGLGLGLAISAGIVRELGGTLKADDVAADGGASFTLRLRRARGQDLAGEAARQTQTETHRAAADDTDADGGANEES
ncbi:sensor histidine kinase [Trinickia dinghuensis]|uniref:C4-dicarboxylate transport sensor protein DctB n=1 Tax=Trinickia dinghuensis TaxID=2291023 RepID=A0A3D8JZB5_9BURK|nr:ATP-binding protein [Trinickia dinghuensis]RDU98230.1 sensor histidine kinase [Trinickia dinghuensis]